MSKFTTYKLEEIAEVQTGPFGSQLHMSDYKKEGTPIITVEHLGENRIIHKNLPLVGDEDKNRLKKYTLKEGDIVFSRVGSVDRCAYVSAKEDDWMFSGRCLRVRTNDKVDSLFLSFYFNQESFKEYIRMIAVGATMPSINTTILSEVEIVLPPLNEQKIIAETLSSLDDKIDLLHRQNKTLEQLAETLFRQWFVEKSKLTIQLGEIAKISTGKGLKRTEFIDNGIYPILGANGEIGRTNNYLTDDKLILTGRVGTLGEVKISNERVWISDNVLIIRPVEERYFYPIYFSLKKLDFENINAGSTQPLITQTDLKKVEIETTTELLTEFQEQCRFYFDKIGSNNKQIRTLRYLRDTILPKLISGEAALKN